MAFVVSAGQLAATDRPSTPAPYSLMLPDGGAQDYATIWKTQPQVRTVVSSSPATSPSSPSTTTGGCPTTTASASTAPSPRCSPGPTRSPPGTGRSTRWSTTWASTTSPTGPSCAG